MSRRVGSRALAVGSLAVGIAAGVAAVLSALGAPAASVSEASAAASQHPGPTCFRVQTVRSCASHVAANEIRYVSRPGAVGGVAGANVRAVIVRLTRRGTVWATLKRGAFYAAVPAGYRARAVVKVLRDGSRKAFVVTSTR